MQDSKKGFYSLNENPEFKQLPIFVQENIKQSGIRIRSSEHLKKICENITESSAK